MNKETRNYLTTVIFRIDSADPIKLLPDNIEKVKTKIEDRLSELNKGQLEMIEVAMGPEEQRTIRKKSDVFDFKNKEENEQLQNFFQEGDFLFKAKNLKGPVSLLKKGSKVNNEFIDKSCRITARYCDRNEEENEEVNISYYNKSKELVRTIKVKPLIEDELEILRIQG